MIKSAGLAAAMLLISFPALSADGVYTMDELKKTYIPELLTAESGIKGAEALSDGVLKVTVGQADFDKSLSRDDTALFLSSALCRAYDAAGDLKKFHEITYVYEGKKGAIPVSIKPETCAETVRKASAASVGKDGVYTDPYLKGFYIPGIRKGLLASVSGKGNISLKEVKFGGHGKVVLLYDASNAENLDSMKKNSTKAASMLCRFSSQKGELASGKITDIIYRYEKSKNESFAIVLNRGNCK